MGMFWEKRWGCSDLSVYDSKVLTPYEKCNRYRTFETSPPKISFEERTHYRKLPYFCTHESKQAIGNHTSHPALPLRMQANALSTVLSTADSLANIVPDSAIRLLESIKTEIATAPEATQMYYRLLCIKAKDKAYILNTTDSLILPTLNYYIKKNDKRHLPEAYYYAGRVYRDLGDAPQALPYFYKAMEVLPKDTESPLKGKIYSQISSLLLSQDLYNEGLEVLKEGYRYSLSRKDSIDMLFCLRDIGSAYREMEKPDSTLHYFREARKLAYEMDNKRMIYMIEGQVAAVCLQLEDWENAKQALDIAIKSTYLPGLSSTYSIAANYYYLTGQPDSTIYYCKRMEDVGNVYGKRSACLYMGAISLDRGNPQAALKYLNQYLLYNDSVSKLKNAETVRKMHSIYNYRLREKENDALKAENSRKTQIMTYAISSGLILLLLFLLYCSTAAGNSYC